MSGRRFPRFNRHRGGVAAIYLLAAILLTYPTIFHLTTQIPLGSETSSAVPFLNVWTQGWNGMALRGGLQGYWDAPIFYPISGSFAFADPQPLTAPISAALWLRSPALNYNLILLAFITLNGICTFGLLRRMDYQLSTAVMGGLIVQALPYLTHERGVIQLIPLFGPLLTFHAALDLQVRHGVRQSLILAAAMAVTVFSSEYLALATAIPLVILAALSISRQNLPKTAGSYGLALVLILLVALPLGIAQGNRLSRLGLSRTISTFAETSAQPGDYLRLTPRARSTTLRPDLPLAAGNQLSPGIILSLAGIPGIYLGWREQGRRRWVLFLALMTSVMFALSFGSNLNLAGWAPLETLFQNVTLLRWTRSTFRFSLFVQLGCALLSLEFIRWVFHKRKPLSYILILLILAELAPLPETLVQVPAHADWEITLPDRRPLAIAHLPWPAGSHVGDFEQTSAWMIQSLLADAQIANGYSGFFPAIHRQMRFLMPHFPRGNTTRVLQAMGIEIVIYHGAVESERAAQIQDLIDRDRLVDLGRTPESWTLAMPSVSLRSVSEYPGSWSMRVDTVDGQLKVQVHAEVPDDQVYLYAPGRTPVSWELVLCDQSTDWHLSAIPIGSGLIYHGSDIWLQINTAWKPPGQDYELALRDLSAGALLARYRQVSGEK